MTRMRFAELRLACAELAATKAMRIEAEREHAQAALVRELSRRRVTQRPSRWLASEREVWRRHAALQLSLRALAIEAPLQHVGHAPGSALSCPACQPGARARPATTA